MTKPVVILVRPQMGENIGAAARAMLNFGLDELRLVAPRDGWPSAQADAMSAGALDKMSAVQVFESVCDAIADCHYIAATTARLREMNKPVLTPSELAETYASRSGEGQKVALLFGAERSGLNNDEVAMAHSIVNIPANPDFSSLNLAQAVLLVGYEMFQAQCAIEPVAEVDPPAPQADFENFFTRLESELDKGGFFRTEELKPITLRNLRTMFLRGDFSQQEISTLHGIVTSLRSK